MHTWAWPMGASHQQVESLGADSWVEGIGAQPLGLWGIWFPGLNLIYLPKCPVQIPDLPPPKSTKLLILVPLITVLFSA